MGEAIARRVSDIQGVVKLPGHVLQDARQELEQLFDESVGMTGEARWMPLCLWLGIELHRDQEPSMQALCAGTVELAELDGPFVKLRLKGRFWHKRADVLARVAAYLRRRIPDIIEIDIEDDSQLDDSASNF